MRKHLEYKILFTSALLLVAIMVFGQDDFKGKGTFPYSDLTTDDLADTISSSTYQGPRLINFGPLKDEMSTNPVNDLLKPNRVQYDFMQLEMGLFIHYGMNTYSGQGTGGTGRFPPEIFNPTALDCDNWMETAKAMGAKYAVLTARHEEGFCLWPTKTTDYSIRSSPYKNGKGDIVREFVEACRRYGIKPCLYISSYMDAHHIFKPGDSISWYQEWFKTTRKRLAEPSAAERFTNMQKEQIRELLTNYGPITYLWLDHIGETQSIFDPVEVDKFWVQIVEEARRLQPECLLLSMDVGLTSDSQAKGGVHGGRAEYPLWYASKRINNKVSQGWPVSDPDSGDQFIVWESNTIFSGGWFWNGPKVKSVEEMKKHYLYTVGRGSTFLPNFAPDKRGLMTETVMERANAFGQFVRHFDKGIAETSGNGTVIELKLPGNVSINHILIQEELSEGQKVLAYSVEAKRKDGSWVVVAEGQSIGHKRIHPIESFATEALRLRIINKAADGIKIKRFAAIE